MAELTIGERIRELRRGIFTQHDLAAAADVSVDVIRNLSRAVGTPPLSPPLPVSPECSAWTSPNCWAAPAQLPLVSPRCRCWRSVMP